MCIDKMRRIVVMMMAWMAVLMVGAQPAADTLRREVLLETSMGNIRIALSNETPKHRDNFLKLVRNKTYDRMLFHRVVKNFMIQTGDPASKTAKKGQKLGGTPDKYTVPAEIRFPALFHKRGAIAAAREDDDKNPKWASSSTQFYIVYGWDLKESQIDYYQHKLDTLTGGKVVLPPEVREVYARQGGCPHLDGRYTVFGEVVEGIDVVEKIQAVETDALSRPKEDVRILKATIVK